MFVNLTPHNVTINGLTLEPAGPAPRVNTIEVSTTIIDGIEVVDVAYGDIDYLPPRAEDTWYIVSKMCADAAPDRDDLLYPGSLVRDEGGRIIGCRHLARNA